MGYSPAPAGAFLRSIAIPQHSFFCYGELGAVARVSYYSRSESRLSGRITANKTTDGL